MLFLLRNIRKKLIEEDNVRKYLLYAIGEILLVVIGISIALQINIQSGIQKDAEQEIAFSIGWKSNASIINIHHHATQLESRQTVLFNKQDLKHHYSINPTHFNIDTISEQSANIYVKNAGVVILSVFLPRFFERLELVENGAFVSREAQNRAVYLIQYLVYNTIEFPEYEMPLNKLLVGLEPEDPLNPIDAITDQEKAICASLLDGVISNWESVSDSSPEGIQETFLQREGHLQIEPERLQLHVERRAVDVLMGTLPWRIDVIKLPWMRMPLHVEW